MNTTSIAYHRLCRICCKPADAHPWHGCERFTWHVPTTGPTPEYLAARARLRESA